MTNVLIVDDDLVVNKLIQRILSDQGLNPLQATSGMEALQLVKEHHCDLVICDLNMPGMNGLQVLEHLHKHNTTLPVIILTAQDEVGSAVEAMKCGAFDYLTKPFNHKVLLLTLQKGLAQKKLLEHTQALEKENENYRKRLESMVIEKTVELHSKSDNLEKLNRSLKHTHLDIVRGLAQMLAIKDAYRGDHYERTREYSVAVGQKMGLTEQQLEHLAYVAYLHDLGEIFIDNNILNKQSRLTSEEYTVIRRHPLESVRILENIPVFNPILPAIRSHHEWYNGTGYPDGLKGNDIPLLARIIQIADAFVAMTSERAYRPAMTVQQALLNLNKNRGTQFDPEITLIFVIILNIQETDV